MMWHLRYPLGTLTSLRDGPIQPLNVSFLPQLDTVHRHVPYPDILKQVRDSEFEQQLHERHELAEKDKKNAVELAENKINIDMLRISTSKDAEIQELKARLNGKKL